SVTERLSTQLGSVTQSPVRLASHNWGQGSRGHTLYLETVLLNTLTGEIDCEFHAYVQPQEHLVLSEFCMELTGIKQAQVDEGTPLKICLSQFCKWIHKIQQQKKIIFATGVSESSTSVAKLCAFVTWSDLDLGVCLEYEATYKLFYRRKPKGLSGTMQEVGIEFWVG
uniref:Exonuclease domain-containing protein n=1 Tax=Spermophilus dauricus TaxID=99837 RepID=A0A8C9URG6_SPEDA